MACHAMSGNGWDMGYPPEGKCMECHATNSAKSPAISKLADYYNEHKAVPWVKIYSLPDEILFSHKRHYTNGKVDCAVCHGPVAAREVITKERSISMESCIDCHKERKAPSTCRSCHNR
jgi:Cytochrome c7 and related cytochrome c